MRRFLSACIHLCNCYSASFSICLLHYLLVCYVDAGASSLTALVTFCLHVVSASSARSFRYRVVEVDRTSCFITCLLLVTLCFNLIMASYRSVPFRHNIFSQGPPMPQQHRHLLLCIHFPERHHIFNPVVSLSWLFIIKTFMLPSNAYVGTRKWQTATQN